MPTPCVIRFTDNDGNRLAHVHRDQHGHPEEVVTNLSWLKRLADRQRGKPAPGNIAAQFIFLDTLWYAVRELPFDSLEEELRTVLYAPSRTETRETDSYHRQHAFLDSTTSIEAVSFLYEVELGESDWQVRISHIADDVSGSVDEIFETVDWGFSGDLDEAFGRFH